MVSSHLPRRRFVQGLGLALAAPVTACGGTERASAGPECSDPIASAIAAAPDGRLDLTGMPYRQDDPRWGREVMWDRDLVLRAATELNGESPEVAESLIREFEDGNTIANEGCMLTCLAMVLRLFAPDADPTWTPAALNELAHLFYYYTPSGLSLTTLYGDLVSDATVGEVQLALKEEYLTAQAPWPRVRASTSALVRAYRSLPESKRSNFLVMLKTGTYLDTVASHYVILHPADTGGPDDDDPLILDPAQPLVDDRPWRLTDSAAQVKLDPDIAAAWDADGIAPTDLGGVWVFARWPAARDRSPLAPLVAAWARELVRAQV